MNGVPFPDFRAARRFCISMEKSCGKKIGKIDFLIFLLQIFICAIYPVVSQFFCTHTPK